MSPLTLLTVAFSISVTVSYGHLRLKKLCYGGDQMGTNLTLIQTDGELDCARACGLNTDCNFMSYHGNACAMYTDEPTCKTGVGETRAIYKVEPLCEPGWQSYSGSCYSVVQEDRGPIAYGLDCVNRQSLPVGIGNAAENDFLVQMLDSINVSNTTVWIGGGYNFLGGDWFWVTEEPWLFENWGNGQPGSELSSCLNSDDGKWYTSKCDQSTYGICEKSL